MAKQVPGAPQLAGEPNVQVTRCGGHDRCKLGLFSAHYFNCLHCCAGRWRSSAGRRGRVQNMHTVVRQGLHDGDYPVKTGFLVLMPVSLSECECPSSALHQRLRRPKKGSGNRQNSLLRRQPAGVSAGGLACTSSSVVHVRRLSLVAMYLVSLNRCRRARTQGSKASPRLQSEKWAGLTHTGVHEVQYLGLSSFRYAVEYLSRKYHPTRPFGVRRAAADQPGTPRQVLTVSLPQSHLAQDEASNKFHLALR